MMSGRACLGYRAAAARSSTTLSTKQTIGRCWDLEEVCCSSTGGAAEWRSDLASHRMRSGLGVGRSEAWLAGEAIAQHDSGKSDTSKATESRNMSVWGRPRCRWPGKARGRLGWEASAPGRQVKPPMLSGSLDASPTNREDDNNTLTVHTMLLFHMTCRRTHMSHTASRTTGPWPRPRIRLFHGSAGEAHEMKEMVVAPLWLFSSRQRRIVNFVRRTTMLRRV
ncbi:hypothetical protein P154DRAFT_603276 [Amniculicola lignicola CBS 123094]|uniref:Uncharacterized protein n=1 Tax=Amniculicola lignicola CBS 123094 TaxID=1392246 RepID=A0A6A5W924_9PLEO|nr:hypothetical protein P154DRAFT_603276 [Amniculicola lignicola CBS 123094]